MACSSLGISVHDFTHLKGQSQCAHGLPRSVVEHADDDGQLSSVRPSNRHPPRPRLPSSSAPRLPSSFDAVAP
eukprot:4364113-Pleurochrysis_carterae.AAC.1